jgi:hypothetical protein
MLLMNIYTIHGLTIICRWIVVSFAQVPTPT